MKQIDNCYWSWLPNECKIDCSNCNNYEPIDKEQFITN
jgi:hypothetical protein